MIISLALLTYKIDRCASLDKRKFTCWMSSLLRQYTYTFSWNSKQKEVQVISSLHTDILYYIGFCEYKS